MMSGGVELTSPSLFCEARIIFFHLNPPSALSFPPLHSQQPAMQHPPNLFTLLQRRLKPEADLHSTARGFIGPMMSLSDRHDRHSRHVHSMYATAEDRSFPSFASFASLETKKKNALSHKGNSPRNIHELPRGIGGLGSIRHLTSDDANFQYSVSSFQILKSPSRAQSSAVNTDETTPPYGHHDPSISLPIFYITRYYHR
ncbi:hypothetical protein F5B19DRAFT_432978 [Rostrohypoxylon terebratum]|nr:hypothetical protein F5B19DRAFT_432978 [Rostrohypoxylon terebratum]